MTGNKRVFDSVLEDGTNVKLAVIKPNPQQQQEANMVYNKTVNVALSSGALFREKLDIEMRKQGLWNDEKQKEFDDINKTIIDGTKAINAGGIKKSVAYQLAIDVKRARIRLRDLITEKTSKDAMTVEGQAENAKFNALISLCTVYNDTGLPVFTNLNDYLNRSNNQVGIDAANQLAQMMYGYDSDNEYKLPENRFLKQHKYVDDKLRLINTDGKLVDLEGRLINEDGRYINEKGEFVDIDGNLVSEEGDFLNPKPFLDDDGNPIVD